MKNLKLRSLDISFHEERPVQPRVPDKIVNSHTRNGSEHPVDIRVPFHF